MKDKILDIIDGNSSRIRLNYFEKNYPDVLNDIQNYCINISDLPFVQKIWHYCNYNPNYVKCSCGKDVKFNRNWLDGYKYGCSAKCTQQNPLTKLKRKQTTIDKYGVDNIAKLDESKLKAENTNIEKYGTKSSFQNKDVKNKWSKNIKDKYGVDHIFQLEEIKEKSKQKNLEKYGKEYYTQTDEYLNKFKKHNLEKYGKEFFTQTEDFLNKVKTTNIEKYGKEWIFNTDKFKSDYLLVKEETINKVKEILKPINERKIIEKFDSCGFHLLEFNRIENTYELSSNDCGHTFKIYKSTFDSRKRYNREICTICNTTELNGVSCLELEIKDFISQYIDIEHSNRTVISPYEVDIYIESRKLAIEFNGLWWHGEHNKDKNYHLMKFDLLSQKGISVINIWEDEWVNKKDIIKSMLLNRIGVSMKKIYARKCIITNVNYQDSTEFLNNNHIQGSVNTSINLGLYYNNELVSLMTFNNRYINSKNVFELVRFCNKINTNIVGSASKLFKHLMSNYKVSEIVSYADRSQFSGDLYSTLGFTFVHRTDPNYWWVIDGIRKHRFTYNKKKLVELGHPEWMTEVEIMHTFYDAYRIYGVGMDKYIYRI